VAGAALRRVGACGSRGRGALRCLSEGQHPQTEAQLVRHQMSKTYEGKNGKEITSVEHRAGWDATFLRADDSLSCSRRQLASSYSSKRNLSRTTSVC